MRKLDLSPRLRSIADLVPPGARFADVGTDHAYLPAWLLLNNVIDHAIVSDLNAGPLENARQTAERYGIVDKFSFRLCDGLNEFTPGEADVVSIGGMGGETIAYIVAAAKWTTENHCRLLLQPMSAQTELRTWLAYYGYRIEREILSREGDAIYSTFLVYGGDMGDLTRTECWAGKQSREFNDPLRGAYLDKLSARAEKERTGLRGATQAHDLTRLAELDEVAGGLKDMRNEWNLWQQ